MPYFVKASNHRWAQANDLSKALEDCNLFTETKPKAFSETIDVFFTDNQIAKEAGQELKETLQDYLKEAWTPINEARTKPSQTVEITRWDDWDWELHHVGEIDGHPHWRSASPTAANGPDIQTLIVKVFTDGTIEAVEDQK